MSVIFALAALIAGPEFDQAFSRSLIQTYPEWALRADKSAGAIVSLWMDPNGRIYDCKTLYRMGDERLADEICGLILRKRVSPARGRNGLAMAGNVVTLIKLTIPGTPMGDKIGPTMQAPDLSLELNRLPEKLVSPHDLELAIEINTEGAVVGCNGDKEADGTLASLACERVTDETFDKAVDGKGNSIEYVRSLKVSFSLPERK